MQITGHITPHSLMSLEVYAQWRKTHQHSMRAHRQLRCVSLNPHVYVQFENEITIRYQIQEMLRIEKVFEPEEIVQEIAAYQPLVPTGTHWKGTLMLAYPDAAQRELALAQLIGVEDRLFIEIEDLPRVYAIADEDLDRDNPVKTSAVHFVRFELTPVMRAAVKAGAPVALGCDHTHCVTQTRIAPDTLACLAADLH